MTTAAILLAAGQGTRMRSATPKVLHPLAGKPMLHHVVDAALMAGVAEVIAVVGHGAEAVTASLAGYGDRVRTTLQAEQRGTGHAAGIGLAAVSPGTDHVLVLCGDTPLVPGDALRGLLAVPGLSFAMLTCELADPTGYGRIIRDEVGRVVAIREHKDASPSERGIREVNPGVYAAKTAFLREAIAKLEPNNAQGELYLTDVVAIAAAQGGVASMHADAQNLVGVNDRAQLAAVEAVLHARIADRWRRAGVTIRATAIVDADVELGPDVTIEHAVVLRGKTIVGEGARIDVGSVLTDTVVAPRAEVKPYTVSTNARVGDGAQIGPFSHLRPGSDIHEQAHIGNFVETKATVVRRGAKANHLAYLGDGDVGEGANVGAGTIFCNYDGFAKHRTTIGAGAFIGSDSQLVAPITIGAGAYVATGTTVTKDVPADALAIARPRQENKEGYASRLRGRLAAQKAARTK